jgi:tRNA-modifying protein YgfZ
MAERPALEALRQEAAQVPVGAHEVLRARGADRVSFLHRLITGRVEGLAPGEGSPSLLLTVKGHIVAQLGVCLLPDEVRLLVPPGQGTPTAAALSRYAIMDDFTVEVAAGWRPLALHGPRSEQLLAAAGLPVPAGLLGRPPLSHAETAGPAGVLWLVRQTAGGVPGIWCFGEPAVVDDLGQRLAAAGVPALSAVEAEALRIEAGEPRFGAEITDEYFPMEVGLRGFIDYDKGCYLGQEPIVRIRDRGHLNWRLCTLRALEPGEAAAGVRLEADQKAKAGRLTSVGRLPGALPVGLAMLHMSVPVGATVRVSTAAAEGAPPAEGAGMRWQVTGEPGGA